MADPWKPERKTIYKNGRRLVLEKGLNGRYKIASNKADKRKNASQINPKKEKKVKTKKEKKQKGKKEKKTKEKKDPSQDVKRRPGRPNKVYEKITKEQAQAAHNKQSRSSRARKLDENQTSRNLVDDERYLKDPSHYDFRGVDSSEVGKARKIKENSDKMKKDIEKLKKLRADQREAPKNKKSDFSKKIEKLRKKIVKEQTGTI